MITTIGCEFTPQTIEKEDNQLLRLTIMDTAGQEKFLSLGTLFYRKASGCLLVFDLTFKSSFDQIPKWLKELKEQAGKEIVIVLIGNKSDLTDEREVSHEDASKYAEQNGLLYMECSAKDNYNVKEAFQILIESKNFEETRLLFVEIWQELKKTTISTTIIPSGMESPELNSRSWAVTLERDITSRSKSSITNDNDKEKDKDKNKNKVQV